MRALHWRLEDGIPVPFDDDEVLEWAEYMQRTQEDRRVGFDHLAGEAGLYVVSTIFLGLDHGFGLGPPVLWETMIFGPEPLGGTMDRYTSEEAARVGHAEQIEKVKRYGTARASRDATAGDG